MVDDPWKMKAIGADEALRLDGQANIAAPNRRHARDPQRTLKLLQTA
jgi:hypothetical protein